MRPRAPHNVAYLENRMKGRGKMPGEWGREIWKAFTLTYSLELEHEVVI